MRLLDFFTNSTTLCSSYPHAYAQYHNKNRQHYDRNTAYAYPYFNLSNSEFTGNALDDAIKLTISQGAPAVYGEELGVSFDRVQEAIDALSRFDPGYGNQKIMLDDLGKKRYTKIGLSISCEYCCGAKAIIFPNGEAACGCAHSQAMRGLAAYLLKNYGTEYSDDEILRELAMWKGMFFPKQMIQKNAPHALGISKSAGHGGWSSDTSCDRANN